MPDRPSIETSLSYFKPILTAYHDQSYAGLEKAIFPSFFHGKCLDEDGNEPSGCPNPDCPIVCGTPGSLIHFYPKLRYIAFNETYHLLQALFDPSSEVYKQVEDAVVAAANQSPQRRRTYSRVFARGYSGAPVSAIQNKEESSSAPAPVPPVPAPGSGSHAAPPSTPGAGASPAAGDDSLPGTRAGSSGQPAAFSGLFSGGKGFSSLSSLSSLSSTGKTLPGLKRRSPDIKAGLRSICDQMHPLMEEACGGDGVESTNGLPNCSWEAQMKEYILTFP